MNLKEAELAIAERQPFTAGNLSGAIEGRVNQNWLEVPVYVVRSYGVAIAESSPFLGQGEVFPSAYTYSKTTSKHANLVERVWGLNEKGVK